MNCPVCGTALRPVDRQGIEVDVCDRCRGVWLDRGELDRLIERSGRAAFDDDGYWGDRDRPDRPPAHHPKRQGFFGRFFDFD